MEKQIEENGLMAGMDSFTIDCADLESHRAVFTVLKSGPIIN